MEKNSNFEIVPGKGYHNLPFGIEYSKVIDLLGDPDEIIEGNEEEEELAEEFANSKTAFYDEHGLAMFFEEINEGGPMTLQSIEIDDEEATLFGKNMFTMNKKEIMTFIEQQTKEKGVVDHDEDFAEFDIVDFEKAGISLQFENEELISITIYNLD